LIRIGFIVRWIMALAIGCSVAHAVTQESIETEFSNTAFRQDLENGFDFCQRAGRVKGNMNENETTGKLNPKLEKILARLVRAQEQFSTEEKGEADHSGKPPIGMKSPETVAETPPSEEPKKVGTKEIDAAVELARV
jgi:hypothetical protein